MKIAFRFNAFMFTLSCCMWSVQPQTLEITTSGTNIAGGTNFQLKCTVNYTFESEFVGPFLSTVNPLYNVDLITNDQVLTVQFRKLSLSQAGTYTCTGYYFFNDSATCSNVFSLMESYNVEVEGMTT